MKDHADQLIAQAITDVIASGAPAVGATVGTRGRDRAMVLVSVVDGIGTLQGVDGDTATASISEIFDANAVYWRTMELAAVARTLSTN